METKEIVFRQNGKKWRFPEIIRIDGGYQYAKVKPLRYAAPKKGEYYLSGAIPEIYRALDDMPFSEFVIVELVERYKQITRPVWVKLED